MHRSKIKNTVSKMEPIKEPTQEVVPKMRP